MGPSIMAAGAVWGMFRTPRGRAAGFLAAAMAMSLLTPPVRAAGFLAILPDWIEGYIRPRPGFTNFAFFPWAGFVFAGALVGVLLDETRTRPAERAANLRFAAGGLLLALAAFGASFLPSPYARSEFWTSSPSFFFIRTGILVAAVGMAYAMVRSTRFSPLQQLGRTSLFIYWIHVEMIYGLVARPLHKSLSFPAAVAGWAVFCVFMLACSLFKDRVVEWWRARPRSGVTNLQSAT
jgi:fucose 4-O-acetylase-like acetyltransferase